MPTSAQSGSGDGLEWNFSTSAGRERALRPAASGDQARGGRSPREFSWNGMAYRRRHNHHRFHHQTVGRRGNQDVF